MKKFGVGVFGIGWVAKEHVRAYTYNPHVRVVSLASRKKESAQRCKDELGLDCEILPCLLYTSPRPRDRTRSRMPSFA